MGIIEFFVENYILLLAVYGAILSTIGIIWKIYSDRPKIRVNAKFGFMEGSEKTFFFVTAINNGRRHVNLSSVGIRCEENDLLNIKTISLPYQLNEGASHTEWFDVEELRNRPCSFAWYKSQTGKLYKSKSIRKKMNNYFNSEKKENKK